MNCCASMLLTVLLWLTACAPLVAAEQEEPSIQDAISPADEVDEATDSAQEVDADEGEDTDAASDEEEEEEEDESLMSAGTFSGLRARCVGPSMAGGRIGDFAVNPDNPAHFFIAVASGGVWKTENAGTTWKPVFDNEGSYSIGCVEIDPNNHNVVWVGTGENNSQRSVSFGDGVYKSVDGGKNWKNMGLKSSEHIGMIAIDPRDSSVVYVAAQGPLWRAGDDRGLYKTTDGGETWERILHVSDDTGINEIHLDPRDPDTMYASAYQRRRRVWTQINGGPESAIYKSTDGGQNLRKLKRGLPGAEMGRIGMDISPANPDVVYAIIQSQGDAGGFFRSLDRGETWEKRSGYMTTSPQYYNEIFCDPREVDRVYALDTILQVSNDGGKSFQRMPRENRHVDDHALWIDPQHTDHLLVGCDGGVYETYDGGKAWQFKPNLPIAQFYRVEADTSEPFYYVYGGTQDNNTMGGPSRTTERAGITNGDWFVTVGGDGYETQIDPVDPSIVYSLWQYGGLVRFDRRSGEEVNIRPVEAPGEAPLRWNWDTPLIISPHDHKRLYVAANVLYRSDDRGDSWRAVSGDLSRQVDRNQLEVMGKIQSFDAVAKNLATSAYGNIVALSESPLVEGLIYVGTDDGLIQVTENGGRDWRRIESFPDLPELVYVSCITASRYHPDRVYAAFDNHKNGDLAPYILRSDDRGNTWQSVIGDLPERHIVYSVVEDHIKDGLLFAGTEFAAFFSPDGGEKWIKLKGGMPTIAVRDIDIQERESDLVLGTFGRSIYVLDDYSPLRVASEELFEQDAFILPIKDALRYIPRSRIGGRNGKGSQGSMYYASPNPPFGAVFTYYMKDKLETRKETRKRIEKEAAKEEMAAPYPSWEEIRAEEEEIEPSIMLIVRDDDGAVVRRIKTGRGKGLQRVAWDLRYPASTPTQVGGGGGGWWGPPTGPLALPGRYSVQLVNQVDGVMSPLTDAVGFNVVALDLATFAAQNKEEVLAFQMKVSRLQRAVRGALRSAGEAETRLNHIRQAILDTPAADSALLSEAHDLTARLKDLLVTMRGDRSKSRREEPVPPSINGRISQIVGNQWNVTSPPTQTQRDSYAYAATEFEVALAELKALIRDVEALEATLEDAGAPWTPGRLIDWKPE